MRSGLLLVGSLALVGCAARPVVNCPAPEVAGSPPPKHGALVVATRYCDVEYTAGGAADAHVLATIADRAAIAIEKELTIARAPFRGMACRIHQHGAPDETAGDGHSSSQRFDVDGEYSVDAHYLALSKHSKTALTSAGQPMDADYLAKLVYAELASVALDRTTKQKKHGFRMNEAPSWFTAGYPEYLAVTLSSERYRTVVLPRYVSAVRADPSRIVFGARIEVKARWNEGAVLLAYLHDTYGKAKVQALVMSDKPTFEEAFAATFGVGLASLDAPFAAWLAKT
ncbi:MAG: hypothetical protein ACXVEF_00490 [Polyangiales bacterium]